MSAALEKHPRVFNGLLLMIAELPRGATVLDELIRWEAVLLADLGFGLDLATCAITGETTCLAWVSPKTGRAVTEQAAGYAKVREQFGRPIATFQAVKHHCANMLVATELATAAVGDAARAGDGDQLSYTAAIAATLAVPGAVQNAQLNIQVHGGIGFTWEHDAHLYLRRAAAIAALADAEAAAADVTGLVRRGVRRAAAIDLPPEADEIRASVRPEAERLRDLDGDARRRALIESGLLMPHWPKPWGRDAGAVEHAAEIFFRELAIGGKLFNAEVVRTVVGAVGDVFLDQFRHEICHLWNVLRGTHDRGLLDADHRRVF